MSVACVCAIYGFVASCGDRNVNEVTFTMGQLCSHRRSRSAVEPPVPRPRPVERPPVYVLLIGLTGAGKTSFVNVASGSSLEVGHGLSSCTRIVQISQPIWIRGVRFTLIDTPGFNDPRLSNTVIVIEIVNYLRALFVQSHLLPALLCWRIACSRRKRKGEPLVGVIYMHRISDNRGKDFYFKLFELFCGKEAYPNVRIVTTKWGEVEDETGHRNEREISEWKTFGRPVVARGGEMLRHDGTKESAHAILEHFVDKGPVKLRVQREWDRSDGPAVLKAIKNYAVRNS